MKYLGYTEANYDYTIAIDPIEIEYKFDWLSSILYNRYYKNHDLYNIVSLYNDSNRYRIANKATRSL